MESTAIRTGPIEVGIFENRRPSSSDKFRRIGCSCGSLFRCHYSAVRLTESNLSPDKSGETNRFIKWVVGSSMGESQFKFQAKAVFVY